jgi:hypothetical protein
LHTRGKRAKPGDRDRTHEGWAVDYALIRAGQVRRDADAYALARECLDARDAPDPLVWALAGRMMKLAGMKPGDRLAPGLVELRRGRAR